MRASDVSEIYAQLRSMEESTRVRFDELRQDMGRIESNADTTKRFFGEQLAEVQRQSNETLDRTRVYDNQLELLQQQTAALHSSLSTIHTQSSHMTSCLSTMMNRFEKLSFDLPTMMDQWMIQRHGEGTISSSQLQRAGFEGGHPKLPTLLPMLPLPMASQTSVRQTQDPPQPSTDVTAPSQTGVEETPSRMMFAQFIHSQESASAREAEGLFSPVERKSAEAGVAMAGRSGRGDELPVGGEDEDEKEKEGVRVKLEDVEEEDEKMLVDNDESGSEETDSGDTGIGETDADGDDEDEEAKVWRTVSPIDEEHLSSLTEYSYTTTPTTSQSRAAATQSRPTASPNIVREHTLTPPVGMLTATRRGPSTRSSVSLSETSSRGKGGGKSGKTRPK